MTHPYRDPEIPEEEHVYWWKKPIKKIKKESPLGAFLYVLTFPLWLLIVPLFNQTTRVYSLANIMWFITPTIIMWTNCDMGRESPTIWGILTLVLGIIGGAIFVANRALSLVTETEHTRHPFIKE